MKIISLQASNVKRLRAVEITPDGSTIIIGGKNGAGKTSVLDSIAAALGGKKLCPKVPIRKGESKAEVRVELDDLVVIRRWTPGESHLSVETKDGLVHRSPQRVLDNLVGKLTFDPLEFSRQDAREQLATVQALVGLDFTELEQDRAKAYDTRRDVNRDQKAAEARLAQMTEHEDAPDAEISVAQLVKELEQRIAQNEENGRITAAHADAVAQVHVRQTSELGLKDYIERLEAEHIREHAAMAEVMGEAVKNLEAAKAAVDEAHLVVDQRAETVNILITADEAEVRADIAGAEVKNLKLRENTARREQAQECQRLEERSKELTTNIASVDEAKRVATVSVEYPIEGLAVGENGVTFDGLPLEQASSAELLRVSAAVGFALNPKLRVLLIRDGSLLDEDSLALLQSMAKEADAQVWIERVGEGGASVVIEDGAVKGQS